jgi:hypothetical protein
MTRANVRRQIAELSAALAPARPVTPDPCRHAAVFIPHNGREPARGPVPCAKCGRPWIVCEPPSRPRPAAIGTETGGSVWTNPPAGVW